MNIKIYNLFLCYYYLFFFKLEGNIGNGKVKVGIGNRGVKEVRGWVGKS